MGCADGSAPMGGLVQATDGSFYGTTGSGGASNSCDGGCGTLFKITAGGALTRLHSFDSTDGAYPFAGLIEATDGNFYGTTYEGGAGLVGTVFKITPGGRLTTLHSFANSLDGAWPYAEVVQGTDGNFYGTASQGGANYSGTVFKITPTGTLTTLYSFCAQTDCTDGFWPMAPLTQATDGGFYGTTQAGGDGCQYPGCGTVFKITAEGTLSTLHSFDGTDGGGPEAGLVQATDGNFYGTTVGGGGTSCLLDCGTVFKITAAGSLTTLHSFAGYPTDGGSPFSTVLQDTDGTFYGTTLLGGAEYCQGEGCGTAFSLSVGLGPFVETLPTSGKIGAAVKILGNHLTGATSVTFNGTSADFTVVSPSEITTTVPSGATSGSVQVTLPSHALSSNVPFRVIP